jgi:hypothetical protein
MSADRRTLVVAAGAMVALILVGVVSAAIFTQSSCAALVPEPIEARDVGVDAEAVLGAALPDLDAEAHGQIVRGLQDVVGEGGTVLGAADVTGADRLQDTGGRLAATGAITTVLAAPGEPPVATAELSDDATVVGTGDSLYALAIVNDLTGQVDALAALGGDLAEQDCTDTATVGVPLAFHLDARDGLLALFRVAEDGDGPELQLRDDTGPIWEADLELGSGPPGILAERLRARVGRELLVTARRSLVDEEAPALAAFELSDGEPRWTVPPAALEELAPSGASALVPRVVAVEPEAVVVALTREEDSPATLLVGLDAADGEIRWTSTLDADRAPRLADRLDDRLLLLAEQDELQEVVLLDPEQGESEPLHATGGQLGSAAVVDGQVLVGVDGGLARVTPSEDAQAVSMPGRVLDVVEDDGRAAVLLGSEDGAAVVWLRLGEA